MKSLADLAQASLFRVCCRTHTRTSCGYHRVGEWVHRFAISRVGSKSYISVRKTAPVPALAGYNGSSGSTVYSDKVRNAGERRWKVDNLPW